MSGGARESREVFRRACVEGIPRWYSPWVHLAFLSAVGLALVALAIAALDDLRPIELFAVPAVFLLANAGEWRAHRDLLHNRTRLAARLYDQHTPEHHRIFLAEDMAIRSAKEFRLVLIPSYAIPLIFLITLPVTGAVLLLGQRNLAALFVATSMSYVLCYEWLHLSDHVSPDSFLGRRRLLARLRRHHAIHHHPALMRSWNLNVAFPLWDHLRGTIYRGPIPGPRDRNDGAPDGDEGPPER
jgi:sterol desaturase/sphingolipid hydroxylase (fatty acid hydroxylase superfamily)